MKANVKAILNVTKSQYQFRFNNMLDMFTFVTRHKDELHMGDFNDYNNNDFPERSKFDELITRNTHMFTKTPNEVIVKSDLNNLINLDILDVRAEDNMLIIVVSYGSNNYQSNTNKWHLLD